MADRSIKIEVATEVVSRLEQVLGAVDEIASKIKDINSGLSASAKGISDLSNVSAALDKLKTSASGVAKALGSASKAAESIGKIGKSIENATTKAGQLKLTISGISADAAAAAKSIESIGRAIGGIRNDAQKTAESLRSLVGDIKSFSREAKEFLEAGLGEKPARVSSRRTAVRASRAGDSSGRGRDSERDKKRSEQYEETRLIDATRAQSERLRRAARGAVTALGELGTKLQELKTATRGVAQPIQEMAGAATAASGAFSTMSMLTGEIKQHTAGIVGDISRFSTELRELNQQLESVAVRLKEIRGISTTGGSRAASGVGRRRTTRQVSTGSVATSARSPGGGGRRRRGGGPSASAEEAEVIVKRPIGFGRDIDQVTYVARPAGSAQTYADYSARQTQARPTRGGRQIGFAPPEKPKAAYGAVPGAVVQSPSRLVEPPYKFRPPVEVFLSAGGKPPEKPPAQQVGFSDAPSEEPGKGKPKVTRRGSQDISKVFSDLGIDIKSLMEEAGAISSARKEIETGGKDLTGESKGKFLAERFTSVAQSSKKLATEFYASEKIKERIAAGKEIFTDRERRLLMKAGLSEADVKVIESQLQAKGNILAIKRQQAELARYAINRARIQQLGRERKELLEHASLAATKAREEFGPATGSILDRIILEASARKSRADQLNALHVGIRELRALKIPEQHPAFLSITRLKSVLSESLELSEETKALREKLLAEGIIEKEERKKSVREKKPRGPRKAKLTEEDLREIRSALTELGLEKLPFAEEIIARLPEEKRRQVLSLPSRFKAFMARRPELSELLYLGPSGEYVYKPQPLPVSELTKARIRRFPRLPLLSKLPEKSVQQIRENYEQTVKERIDQMKRQLGTLATISAKYGYGPEIFPEHLRKHYDRIMDMFYRGVFGHPFESVSVMAPEELERYQLGLMLGEFTAERVKAEQRKRTIAEAASSGSKKLQAIMERRKKIAQLLGIDPTFVNVAGVGVFPGKGLRSATEMPISDQGLRRALESLSLLPPQTRVHVVSELMRRFEALMGLRAAGVSISSTMRELPALSEAAFRQIGFEGVPKELLPSIPATRPGRFVDADIPALLRWLHGVSEGKEKLAISKMLKKEDLSKLDARRVLAMLHRHIEAGVFPSVINLPAGVKSKTGQDLYIQVRSREAISALLRKAYPEADIGFLTGMFAPPVGEGHPLSERAYKYYSDTVFKKSREFIEKRKREREERIRRVDELADLEKSENIAAGIRRFFQALPDIASMQQVIGPLREGKIGPEFRKIVKSRLLQDILYYSYSKKAVLKPEDLAQFAHLAPYAVSRTLNLAVSAAGGMQALPSLVPALAKVAGQAPLPDVAKFVVEKYGQRAGDVFKIFQAMGSLIKNPDRPIELYIKQLGEFVERHGLSTTPVVPVAESPIKEAAEISEKVSGLAEEASAVLGKRRGPYKYKGLTEEQIAEIKRQQAAERMRRSRERRRAAKAAKSGETPEEPPAGPGGITPGGTLKVLAALGLPASMAAFLSPSAASAAVLGGMQLPPDVMNALIGVGVAGVFGGLKGIVGRIRERRKAAETIASEAAHGATAKEGDIVDAIFDETEKRRGFFRRLADSALSRSGVVVRQLSPSTYIRAEEERAGLMGKLREVRNRLLNMEDFVVKTCPLAAERTCSAAVDLADVVKKSAKEFKKTFHPSRILRNLDRLKMDAPSGADLQAQAELADLVKRRIKGMPDLSRRIAVQADAIGQITAKLGPVKTKELLDSYKKLISKAERAQRYELYPGEVERMIPALDPTKGLRATQNMIASYTALIDKFIKARGKLSPEDIVKIQRMSRRMPAADVALFERELKKARSAEAKQLAMIAEEERLRTRSRIIGAEALQSIISSATPEEGVITLAPGVAIKKGEIPTEIRGKRLLAPLTRAAFEGLSAQTDVERKRALSRLRDEIASVQAAEALKRAEADAARAEAVRKRFERHIKNMELTIRAVENIRTKRTPLREVAHEREALYIEEAFGPQGAQKAAQFRQVTSQYEAATTHFKRLKISWEELLRYMGRVFVGLAVFDALRRALSYLNDTTLRYAETLNRFRVGVATTTLALNRFGITAQHTLPLREQVRLVSGVASGQVASMELRAARLGVPIGQILEGYQVAAGVARQAGFVGYELNKAIVGLVSLANVMGISMQQLAKTIDNVFSGQRAAQVTMARVLGLSEKMVKEAVAKGTFRQMLLERLASVEEASLVVGRESFAVQGARFTGLLSALVGSEFEPLVRFGAYGLGRINSLLERRLRGMRMGDLQEQILREVGSSEDMFRSPIAKAIESVAPLLIGALGVGFGRAIISTANAHSSRIKELAMHAAKTNSSVTLGTGMFKAVVNPSGKFGMGTTIPAAVLGQVASLFSNTFVGLGVTVASGIAFTLIGEKLAEMASRGRIKRFVEALELGVMGPAAIEGARRRMEEAAARGKYPDRDAVTKLRLAEAIAKPIGDIGAISGEIEELRKKASAEIATYGEITPETQKAVAARIESLNKSLDIIDKITEQVESLRVDLLEKGVETDEDRRLLRLYDEVLRINSERRRQIVDALSRVTTVMGEEELVREAELKLIEARGELAAQIAQSAMSTAKIAAARGYLIDPLKTTRAVVGSLRDKLSAEVKKIEHEVPTVTLSEEEFAATLRERTGKEREAAIKQREAAMARINAIREAEAKSTRDAVVGGLREKFAAEVKKIEHEVPTVTLSEEEFAATLRERTEQAREAAIKQREAAMARIRALREAEATAVAEAEESIRLTSIDVVRTKRQLELERIRAYMQKFALEGELLPPPEAFVVRPGLLESKISGYLARGPERFKLIEEHAAKTLELGRIAAEQQPGNAELIMQQFRAQAEVERRRGLVSQQREIRAIVEREVEANVRRAELVRRGIQAYRDYELSVIPEREARLDVRIEPIRLRRELREREAELQAFYAYSETLSEARKKLSERISNIRDMISSLPVTAEERSDLENELASLEMKEYELSLDALNAKRDINRSLAERARLQERLRLSEEDYYRNTLLGRTIGAASRGGLIGALNEIIEGASGAGRAALTKAVYKILGLPPADYTRLDKEGQRAARAAGAGQPQQGVTLEQQMRRVKEIVSSITGDISEKKAGPGPSGADFRDAIGSIKKLLFPDAEKPSTGDTGGKSGAAELSPARKAFAAAGAVLEAFKIGSATIDSVTSIREEVRALRRRVGWDLDPKRYSEEVAASVFGKIGLGGLARAFVRMPDFAKPFAIAGLAGIGAGIGSLILPGIGTAIGAALGAAIGGVSSFLGLMKPPSPATRLKIGFKRVFDELGIPPILPYKRGVYEYGPGISEDFDRIARGLGQYLGFRYPKLGDVHLIPGRSVSIIANAARSLGMSEEDARAIASLTTKAFVQSPERGLMALMAMYRLGKIGALDFKEAVAGIVQAFEGIPPAIDASIIAMSMFTRTGQLSMTALQRALETAKSVISSGIPKAIQDAVASGGSFYSFAQSLGETFAQAFMSRVSERILQRKDFGETVSRAVVMSERAAELLAAGKFAEAQSLIGTMQQAVQQSLMRLNASIGPVISNLTATVYRLQTGSGVIFGDTPASTVSAFASVPSYIASFSQQPYTPTVQPIKAVAVVDQSSITKIASAVSEATASLSTSPWRVLITVGGEEFGQTITGAAKRSTRSVVDMRSPKMIGTE
ncbi:MAG: hypothetical protein KatS3mg054_0116 [Chloroflexus sp.]|nr:MAG: hypothetical protein KatS3mg054_0116 [Chloroflexus sp.]